MSSKKNSVIIHIYDVPEANKYIHIFTDEVGVYHTGVEVLGVEYSFGGHPYEFSGIFQTQPKNISSLSVSNTFHFKESKVIGITDKDENDIKEMVKQLGCNQFKGKNYHLIRQNCNHFSNFFCKKLCGKSIPEYINKMVELLKQYPIIEKYIPKDFVTPIALENDVKKQNKIKKIQTNSGNSSTTDESDTKTGTTDNSTKKSSDSTESTDSKD